MRLSGKIAVITGGAAGIGRATAHRFAKEGAIVVISDIDEDGGARTLKELQEINPTALFIKTDVSKEENIQHVIETTMTKFDRIDLLFNNAGVGNSKKEAC
ncbi:SDR family NAD(P)-dependent oxidoreductase [Bacillus sp. DJP31]|uniref:SDR family NAD(P)-dependent oxidoreductase n=1 Tax=Bacillus sp. DJP31 TaxID=3409789 RepID=UPI003BB5B29C